MKQEGWTIDYLIDQTNAHIDSLEDNPDYLYKRAGKTKDGFSYKVDIEEAFTSGETDVSTRCRVNEKR